MSLANYSSQLAAVALEAQTWTREAIIVGNEHEREELGRDLRRAGRVFRQCAVAADRQMCAGVFGPSQAGKSYLISALARGEDGALLARFGDEVHDFLNKINPEGEQESTGLVTRFTMRRPASLPAGHPVQVRLLTETDLVKIIANSYYADCIHTEERPEAEITSRLDDLESRAGQGASHIDLDALEDLQDYLQKEFSAHTFVKDTHEIYWKRALRLGPRLDLEGRVGLYALIWDEVEELTELLRRLLLALEKLHFATEAFCPLSALIPKTNSIIDVATLDGLDDVDQTQTLSITTARGSTATLTRAEITALTAELTIVMEKQPDAYFNHTDLLDFPGYRSREEYSNIRAKLEKEKKIRIQMFLRGKVAYLFQRYSAERELTSLLLCIEPRQREVTGLSRVIRDWIYATHGKTPQERANRRVSLFFILTKADMIFVDTPGDQAVRWDNRINTSLLQPFGRDWTEDWDGHHAFNNLFLLRNPNVRTSLFTYTPNNIEISLNETIRDLVDRLGEGFAKSTLAARHFRNRDRVWNALLTPNDGGIGHIRECLNPLCDPRIKHDQIRQTLQETCLRLRNRLAAFHRTDDKDEERRQKTALLNRFLSALESRQNREEAQGLLLRECTVTDRDILGMYEELDRAFRMDERLERPHDEETSLAEQVKSRWDSRLRDLAGDPSMNALFGLDTEVFSFLAEELSTGADRLRLCDSMIADFRRVASYRNTSRDNIIRQQCGMACCRINSYVNWLGFNPRIPDGPERPCGPDAKGTMRPIFTPPTGSGKLPDLGEEEVRYGDVWCSDWRIAFSTLVMDNLNFDGKQIFNLEENRRLGAILSSLEVQMVAESV